jgi:hypothetical protein
MEENDMEYKFSGDSTLDDYVQMNRLIMKNRFSEIGWKIFFIVLGTIFLVAMFFNLNTKNIFEILKSIVDIIWIPIFVLVYFKIILSKWRLRKYYVSNKIYNESKLFEINKKNILINSESINMNIQKDKIAKIEFDKDSIYIFTSLLNILVIKQRFMKDENEYNELKNFILKYYK